MVDGEYGEYLKRRIEEAFGLEDMAPEERAYWDAWDRVWEQKRLADEAFKARIVRAQREFAAEINAHPEAFEPYMPGITAAVNEHGLRFAWEAK